MLLLILWRDICHSSVKGEVRIGLFCEGDTYEGDPHPKTDVQL